jgi:tetratricopeptide (TPR) repeat protein
MDALRAEIVGRADTTSETPKLSVAIITPSSSKPYAVHSLGMKAFYAEANGYAIDFFTYSGGPNSFDWEKLDYIRSVLHSTKGWGRNFDYIAYVDDVTNIVDLGMRIEQIFTQNKDAHFIASEGFHDRKFGSGFFLLRNSVWSTEFLDDWLRIGNGLEGTFVEEDALQKLLLGDEDSFEGYVTLLPKDVLGTPYPAASKFQNHSQVLSLSDELIPLKQRVFSEGFDTLCRVFESAAYGVSIPHQLGLTPSNLKKWSMQVYRSLFEDASDIYATKAKSGECNGQETQELMIKLRNVITALIANGEEESANKLRALVFRDMFLNYKKRRPKNVEHQERTGHPFVDWFQMLDALTLVGAEYSNQLTDLNDKRVAAKVMVELLNELESFDNRYGVKERLMNSHVDVGLIEFRSNKIEDALKHFVEAVKLGRILLTHGIIKEAALLIPFSFAADALFALQRYKEAIVMYGYAIDIGKKTLSPNDEMMPSMKLQYGIACYHDKRYRTAKNYIGQALQYYQKVGFGPEMKNVIDLAIDIYEKASNAKYDSFSTDADDDDNEL